MKALIAAAGTKYFAISIVRAGSPILNGRGVIEILRLDDSKQAQVARVEHARAGIAGRGDIGDIRVEPCPQLGRNRAWRQNS